MVKRNIFIIKGFSKDEKEKSIDNYYAEMYACFFQLSAGGSYAKEEIIVLDEPEVADLTNIFDEQYGNYAITVYIGHGANQKEHQIFQLNEFEIIKPGQFIPNFEKQIIILESCRVVSENIETVDLADKIPKFENGGIFRIALSKEQCREVYDSHINRCENGIMIWYACELGAEAYDFIFSKTLLETAMNWHLDATRHCAVLPVDELSRLTWVDTFINAREKLGIDQYPCSEGNINFPFAISKY